MATGMVGFLCAGLVAAAVMQQTTATTMGASA